jgi:hypothetical protein
MHTLCTLFWVVCTLYAHFFCTCTHFSDIENPTFFAELYMERMLAAAKAAVLRCCKPAAVGRLNKKIGEDAANLLMWDA